MRTPGRAPAFLRWKGTAHAEASPFQTKSGTRRASRGRSQMPARTGQAAPAWTGARGRTSKSAAGRDRRATWADGCAHPDCNRLISSDIGHHPLILHTLRRAGLCGLATTLVLFVNFRFVAGGRLKAHSRLHLLKSIEQPSQACGHRRSIPIKSDAKPRANLMTDGSAMRRLWAAVIWTRFYHGIHLRCPAASRTRKVHSRSMEPNVSVQFCTISAIGNRCINWWWWDTYAALAIERGADSLSGGTTIALNCVSRRPVRPQPGYTNSWATTEVGMSCTSWDRNHFISVRQCGQCGGSRFSSAFLRRSTIVCSKRLQPLRGALAKSLADILRLIGVGLKALRRPRRLGARGRTSKSAAGRDQRAHDRMAALTRTAIDWLGTARRLSG